MTRPQSRRGDPGSEDASPLGPMGYWEDDQRGTVNRQAQCWPFCLRPRDETRREAASVNVIKESLSGGQW